MSVRDGRLDLRWLPVAFAAFLAFLAVEPLRNEIIAFAGGDESPAGWLVFTALRLAALGAAATATYLALPRTSAPLRRDVPRPAPGADPLLSLRAFACLLVLVGHSTAIHFVPSGVPASVRDGGPAWLMMGSPWAGVWVFFVLSGYLMGKGFYSGRYGLNRIDVAAFYRNRLLRIMPLYVAVLLPVLLLLRPEVFTLEYGLELAALPLLTQPPDSPLPAVEALWSIQTEMAFYAVVPLLFLGIQLLPQQRRSPSGMAILMLALLLAGAAYRYQMTRRFGPADWNVRSYVPLLGNIDLFLLGMGLNWLVPGAVRAARGASLLGAAFVSLVLLYAAAAWSFGQASFGAQRLTYMFHWMAFGPILTGLATAAVILLMEVHVAGARPGGLLSRGVLRGTQWIGILAYALYVWHEPVYESQAISFLGGGGMWPALSASAVALAITLVVAGTSYLLIERPFERRKQVR